MAQKYWRRGCCCWPRTDEEVRRISSNQLLMLLSGMDFWNAQKHLCSLEVENHILREKLHLALSRRFGRSSEKIDPTQQERFSKAEVERFRQAGRWVSGEENQEEMSFPKKDANKGGPFIITGSLVQLPLRSTPGGKSVPASNPMSTLSTKIMTIYHKSLLFSGLIMKTPGIWNDWI